MTVKKPLPEVICGVGFWLSSEAEKLANFPSNSQEWQGLRIALCSVLADIYNEVQREIIENAKSK